MSIQRATSRLAPLVSDTAARHGLDETERSWLRDVDRAGLVFANESFSRKRASRRQPLRQRFLYALRRLV